MDRPLYFCIRCGSQQWFTAVSMYFALFMIWSVSNVCLVCVFSDTELAFVSGPDVCPQQV